MIEEYLNQVIQGDCLDLMWDLPDHSVDLCLTDPPFGMPDEEPIILTLNALKLARKKCKNLCVIMDWRNNGKIDSVLGDIKIGELVWEYGWVSGGRTKAKSGFFPTHNTIGLYGDKKDFNFISGSIIKRQAGFSSPRQCSYANKTGHPYEKPVKLMEYLIQGIRADTILDPFAGSGTTGIAARNLKRNFILMEKEPKYVEIIKERLTPTLKDSKKK